MPIGSGDGVLRLQPLPWARKEANAIGDLLDLDPRHVLEGAAASERSLKLTPLASFAALHLAAHARADAAFPERSAVFLSPGSESEDGWLQPREIAGLRLAGRLVVLSACRTAVGPEVRGEGPLSLARSFLDAGAARAIVTLWSVNDEASAELMRRFYRGVLADRLRPPEALRAAQLSMAGEERWQAAYYWAPYVFLGEWR